MIESEIFGHVKGAYTGAVGGREGAAARADGGTLFLDEICEMPLDLQVKLLRFIQTGTFTKVGGSELEKVDVRFVCATNRDPLREVEEGRFREDLYYRLHVFPIEMPPLRERIEDLPLLLNELITRLENEKRGSIRFSSAAIMSLCQHPWPGNVRELANLVERMAIMHPHGVIGVASCRASSAMWMMTTRICASCSRSRMITPGALRSLASAAPWGCRRKGWTCVNTWPNWSSR